MAPAKVHVIDKDTPRDVAATIVHKEFAEVYDYMIKETGRMSGFFVVTFDDEGNPHYRQHLGEFFPIPPPMLPEIIKQISVQETYSA